MKVREKKKYGRRKEKIEKEEEGEAKNGPRGSTVTRELGVM